MQRALRRGIVALVLLVVGATMTVMAEADTRPRRVIFDGRVMMKRLTYRIAPVYPTEARKRGVEGTVKLRIVIGTDGTVRQIRVEGGPELLTQSAVDAVRQWKYEPVQLGNEPVEVLTVVDVVFQLGPKQ